MTTFLFSTTSAPLSRVIRAATKGSVSHCGIGKTLAGVQMVADASLLGIEMVERRQWLKGKILLAEVEVPSVLAPEDSYVLEHLGVGYDYSGMLGYLPVFLARWLGRKIQNPWASPTHMVCSEFLIRGMQQRGQCLDLDPEFYDPQRLLRFCTDTLRL